MERLLKISQENTVLPGELLYRDIAKVLTKGLAHCDVDYSKACARIIALLAEQGEVGVTKLVQFRDNQILQLVVQNFYELKEKQLPEHLGYLIDGMHMLVEFSKAGRKHCLQLASALIGILIDHEIWGFLMRLEISKLINLFLDDGALPVDVRNSTPCRQFITEFGTVLSNAGDYELQATLMEMLFRIVTPQQKQELVRKWFPTERLQLLFVNIRNEAFETDCRHFLNNFNRSDLRNQKVFSYPVTGFALGKYKLQQPKDARVTEFWVDFNVCSKSISTFVNDDSDRSDDHSSAQWEIVSIKKEIVRDVCVNPTTNSIVVLLKISLPACELAQFCPPASEKYVKIVAGKSSGMLRGVEKLFGDTVKQYVSGDSQDSQDMAGIPRKHVSGGPDDSQDVRASQNRRTKCSIVVRQISLHGSSQEPAESSGSKSETEQMQTRVGMVSTGVNIRNDGKSESLEARSQGIRAAAATNARETNHGKDPDTFDRKFSPQNNQGEAKKKKTDDQLPIDEAKKTEVIVPESMDLDEQSERGASESHSVEVVPETLEMDTESEKKEVAEPHSVEVVPETAELAEQSETVVKADVKSQEIEHLDPGLKVHKDEANAMNVSKEERPNKNEQKRIVEEKRTSDESINISADQSLLDSEAEEKKLMDTLKEKNTASTKTTPTVKPPAEEENKSAQKSSRRKRVSDEAKKPRSKKLLSMKKNEVFQDSPDDAYQPAPVKDPDSRQQRKTMSADNITAKMPASKFSFKERRKSAGAADFEFEPKDAEKEKERNKEEPIPDKKGRDRLPQNAKEIDDEKQVAPTKSAKGPKGGRKKKDAAALKEKPAPAPIAETDTLPRRTSRRTRKVVNYAEDTSKDEDTMQSSQIAEIDENEEGEIGTPKEVNENENLDEEAVGEVEPPVEDEETKASNRSVSFVSPIGETSYFEVLTPYSGSEKDKESPALREDFGDDNEDAEMNTSLDISMDVDDTEVQKKTKTSKNSKDNSKELLKEHSRESIPNERSKKSKKTPIEDSLVGILDDEEEPMEPDTIPVAIDISSREMCPVELALVKRPKYEVVKHEKETKSNKGMSKGFKKPFQKNLNIGWGKKVIPSSLLSAFDFDEEEEPLTSQQSSTMKRTQKKTVTHEFKSSGVGRKKETRITMNETSWTGQKLKKTKVKTEYKATKSFKDKYMADQQSSQDEGGFSSQESDSNSYSNNQRKVKENEKMAIDNGEEDHLKQVSDDEEDHSSHDDEDDNSSTHSLGRLKKAKLFYGNKKKLEKKSTKQRSENKQPKMSKKKSAQRQKLCELVGISSPVSSSQESVESHVPKPSKRKVLKKLPPPPPKDTTTDSSQEYNTTSRRKPPAPKKNTQKIAKHSSLVGETARVEEEVQKNNQFEFVTEENFFEQVVPAVEKKEGVERKEKRKSVDATRNERSNEEKEVLKKKEKRKSAEVIRNEVRNEEVTSDVPNDDLMTNDVPNDDLMEVDSEFKHIAEHQLAETDDEFAKAKKLQNKTVIPDTYEGVDENVPVVADEEGDEKEAGGSDGSVAVGEDDREVREETSPVKIEQVQTKKVDKKKGESKTQKHQKLASDVKSNAVADVDICDDALPASGLSNVDDTICIAQKKDELALRAEALISGLQENNSEETLIEHDVKNSQEEPMNAEDYEDEDKENQKPPSAGRKTRKSIRSTKKRCEMDSSQGSSSSVNASQERAEFFETPGAVLNTFGVKDTRRTLEKTFENIEALTKRDVKRKLLKTPVVVLQDVTEMFEVKQKTPQQTSAKKKKTETTTISTKRSTRKNRGETSAVVDACEQVDVQQEEGVTNDFSDFCKSVLSTSSVKRPKLIAAAEDKDEEDEAATNDDSMVISSSAETDAGSDAPENENAPPCNEKTSPRRSRSVMASEERTVLEEIQLPTGTARMSETEKRSARVTISIVDRDEKPASQSTTSCDDDAELTISNRETVSMSVMTTSVPPSQQQQQQQKEDNVDEDEAEGDNTHYFTPCAEPTSSSDLHPILNSFGSDFSKKLNSRKEAFERFSARVTKMAGAKLQEMWKKQTERRKTHDTTFQNKSMNELDDWEAACETKEKNLMSALDTLKRTLKESSAHEKRKIALMKAINRVHAEEKEKMETVEEKEQNNVHRAFTAEVRKLREAELTKAKEQEIVDMRNALKGLLDTV